MHIHSHKRLKWNEKFRLLVRSHQRLATSLLCSWWFYQVQWIIERMKGNSPWYCSWTHFQTETKIVKWCSLYILTSCIFCIAESHDRNTIWESPILKKMTLIFSLSLTMSHNVTQDNMYPALNVPQLFSGQCGLKALLSNNGPSPCQQKQCQSQCQLGMAPMLAVDDSRALKHNVGVPVCRRLCQDFCQFALKQPPCSAPSPPLVLLA